MPDAPSKEVIAWRKEIEKELREKLKFQSKYHVTETYGMKIIKEILGDSDNNI